MAYLSVVRRWHSRDGVPIREIARRTDHSPLAGGAHIRIARRHLPIAPVTFSSRQ